MMISNGVANKHVYLSEHFTLAEITSQIYVLLFTNFLLFFLECLVVLDDFVISIGIQVPDE